MAKVLWICAHLMAATVVGTPEITGWAHQNIGDATAQGNATYNRQARMWVVSGDGHDIYDSADGFHFVFQPLDGDGSIVARIDGLTAANAWAKSGVMIRETLEAGSRWAYVLYAGQNGIRFQARVVTGAAAISDTPVIRPEQVAVRAPLWVKLERKGDQFYGYYTQKEDGAGAVWTPMAGSPRTISMAPTVYVGLAVTSHTVGTLCEARFSNVVVYPSEIHDAEIAIDPGQALRMACARLQRLGDWRHDPSMIEEQGDVIANCLVTLARARESKESAGGVLPEYYRVVELLPRSSPAADALARIVVLDGDKGLAYAMRHLGDRSKEDLDRFHVAVLRGCIDTGGVGNRDSLIGMFIEHVVRASKPTLLLQVLDGFAGDERAVSVCRSLIQQCMAEPSKEPIAVVCLRSLVLKSGWKQTGDEVLDLARWATGQFPGTRLAACATAITADVRYSRGRCAEAVEVFRPGLLSGNRAEPQIVEEIESTVAAYLAGTVLRGVVDMGRIYEALGAKAEELGLHVVALHCYRRAAETKTLSLEGFELSASVGTKFSGSDPENEVWFWKGLLLADAEDLIAATDAYERFLRGDSESVLAARAYYDLARAKMAIGEEAQSCMEKAKALSPCDAVVRLDRQLNAENSL